MIQPPFRLAWLASIFCCVSSLQAAGINVLSWGLDSAVLTSTDLDREFSLTPQSPFQATHMAQIGQSTSTTVYDVVYNRQQFSFLLDAIHTLADVPSIQSAESLSSGSIRLQFAQPVQVTFDLEYQYNIPGSAFQARTSFSVGAVGLGLLFGENEADGPLDLGSPTGSLHTYGSVDVPANTETIINYQMLIRTVGGNSGVVGNANGSLNIHIQSIPEPHSLLLLALALPVIALRRSRRPSPMPIQDAPFPPSP